jgi:hypothetical protein
MVRTGILLCRQTTATIGFADCCLSMSEVPRFGICAIHTLYSALLARFYMRLLMPIRFGASGAMIVKQSPDRQRTAGSLRTTFAITSTEWEGPGSP